MQSIDFDTRAVFVGGHWQSASFGRTLPLINPSDGSELTQIARGGPAEIDAAVHAAQAALDGPWGQLSAAERGRILLRMSLRVIELADVLARMEALDVGKPVKQGLADANALARYLEF